MGRKIITSCMRLATIWSVCVGAVAFSKSATNDNTPAFKIGNAVTTVGDLQEKDQDRFYQVAKEYYDLVYSHAREKFLQTYWTDKAKAAGKSVDVVKAEAIKKEFGASDIEFEKTYAQYKDHPSLKELSETERKRQVREFFDHKREGELADKIIAEAEREKKLEVLVPKPVEPIFKVVINDKDQVRYGADVKDVKPVGCAGDACPVTILELTDSQCPYCARAVDAGKEVLTNYRGKVRWVTRDFPLNFHDRAKPAAVAAHCAGKQDPSKYWGMYYELFANQQKLSDADFKVYAQKIGADMKKFEECVKNPGDVLAQIETNIASGVKLGVKGTPAFFINGRRLSGALPYTEFKRIIDEELNKVVAKK